MRNVKEYTKCWWLCLEYIDEIQKVAIGGYLIDENKKLVVLLVDFISAGDKSIEMAVAVEVSFQFLLKELVAYLGEITFMIKWPQVVKWVDGKIASKGIEEEKVVSTYDMTNSKVVIMPVAEQIERLSKSIVCEALAPINMKDAKETILKVCQSTVGIRAMGATKVVVILQTKEMMEDALRSQTLGS
ncbi:hypothetical protein PIB30_049950 [Stylosanthes scabra]|uniref:Uncharacterized protein n=1 Tax=Stylosanthes scabra TaxID=79078 RepID=A0ABU6UG57_9FABA|nr:hypothetical protein [Stylosanthes scabra]